MLWCSINGLYTWLWVPFVCDFHTDVYLLQLQDKESDYDEMERWLEQHEEATRGAGGPKKDEPISSSGTLLIHELITGVLGLKLFDCATVHKHHYPNWISGLCAGNKTSNCPITLMIGCRMNFKKSIKYFFFLFLANNK